MEFLRPLTAFGALAALVAVVQPVTSSARAIVSGTRPVTFSAPKSPALAKLARELNADQIKDSLAHKDEPLVMIAMMDISPKGQQKALFTQLQSARLCGASGCATSIFVKRSGQWTKVFSDISGDPKLLPSIHHGVYDLSLGKGRIRIWDGRTYVDPED